MALRRMYIVTKQRGYDEIHKKGLFLCPECRTSGEWGEGKYCAYAVIETHSELILCKLADHDFFVPYGYQWRNRSDIPLEEMRKLEKYTYKDSNNERI